MRVKKYTADTMPEAMNLVRKELGSDAVILQSKEVTQGRFLGLFKKKKIEVVAALDPNPVSDKKEVRHLESIGKNKVDDENEKISTGNEVIDEIKKLKEIIEIQNEKIIEDLPLNFQIVRKQLQQQEVSPHIVDRLMQQTRKKWVDAEEIPDTNEIFQELESVIKNEISPFITDGVSEDKKVMQFVGPTGVGKTTTIAKIAADLQLNKYKRIAFITMDTYRIAAIEQLKTYAKILNVPLEIVYNIDDYKKALKKLSDYDHILVDTAGRNFREAKYIEDLKEMVGSLKNIHTYIVLSLTAKQKDVIDIYKQFHTIPLSGAIFTKLDETKQYGNLLNIILKFDIQLAYITNGQDVPDDLVVLTAEEIGELIVGEKSE